MLVELESLYRGFPEGQLYHYTSNAGVLGILESGAMWATEIRYLNDASELVNAFKTIGWAAWERRQEHTGEVADLLKDFQGWCNSAGTTDRTVFVVSLTTEGDLLSQWRAYAGPDGQGVCLELDAQRLQALGAAKGFRLGRCVYGADEQQTLARAVVDHLLAKFPDFDWELNRPAGHESVRFYPLFDSMYTEIMSLAALMKHAAFREEAEWRLVSPIAPSAHVDRLKFRAGRSCVVPYIELALREDDGIIPVLRGAKIGPCQNPNLAMASLYMLFSRHVKTNFTLRGLQVPLRSSV